MMTKRALPLIGVAASLPLLAFAASRYPDGFHVTRNYVCALFQPLALNGAVNTARPWAVPGILILCLSVAYMFWAVSRQCPERTTRKTIEIFGIGTAVYTFLGVNTPMHDLLVVIAAVFFGIAAIGMLRLLHATQRLVGLAAGWLCLALLIALAFMRHGGVRPELAPLTEWLLFAVAIGWLTFVYTSVCGRHARI